jgi:DNA-binding transcriptional regulator YiaG
MTGAEFRKGRKELGYRSIQAVAEAIGVSYGGVRKWENHTRPVPAYAEKWIKMRLESMPHG